MSTRGTTETGNRESGRGGAAARDTARLDEADLGRSSRLGRDIVDAVDRVVAGQREVAEMAAACLLSSGHLLIEDIPGVGKTLLAQVVAAAVGGTFHRIQGTPDLLPGDVTGSMVPDHETFRLRFRPGPMFANVVVFDELNRTNPRTQSALLEAAEEATVTVDGTTHSLPDPFMLVATQNPIELAGTYRLGEGALDRFAAVVTPGRAGFDDEVDVLTGRRGRKLLHDITPVASLDTVIAVSRRGRPGTRARTRGAVRGRVARSDPGASAGASRRFDARWRRADRIGQGVRGDARSRVRRARRRGRGRGAGVGAPGARRRRRRLDGGRAGCGDRMPRARATAVGLIRPTGLSPGAFAMVGAWVVALAIARLTGAAAVVIVLGAGVVGMVWAAAAGWFRLRSFELRDLTTVAATTVGESVTLTASASRTRRRMLPTSMSMSPIEETSWPSGRLRSGRFDERGCSPVVGSSTTSM